MTILHKILKLSDQLSSSFLQRQKMEVLHETDLFSDEEKKYILSNLTDSEKIKLRKTQLAKIDKKNDWLKIQSKLQLEDNKPVRFLTFFKYAAILVVFLGLGFYFYNSQQNQTIVPVKTVVVAPSVQPGTDKATLVLGNGKTIVLGQGNVYNANGILANGKNITYDDSNVTTEYNYLTIPRAGQFSLQLADGTKVWLNSETQLKFPNHFIDGKPRNVELVYGEAYFEVSPSTSHKGSHFNVKVKDQNIEVLGTQFNVKAYNDEINLITTLKEGKVAINYANKKEELLPGEQSIINHSTSSLKITSVNVDAELAWLDGQFVFDNMALKEIVKVLSRWYDVDFVIKSEKIQNEKFKGQFSKNQNLENILELIKSTNQIKSYEMKEKTVIFK